MEEVAHLTHGAVRGGRAARGAARAAGLAAAQGRQVEPRHAGGAEARRGFARRARVLGLEKYFYRAGDAGEIRALLEVAVWAA